MRLSSITALSSPGAVNYKVYSDKFVPVGTKYFLFYGKAIDNAADEAISSRSDKFKYGMLNAKGVLLLLMINGALPAMWHWPVFTRTSWD